MYYTILKFKVVCKLCFMFLEFRIHSLIAVKFYVSLVVGHTIIVLDAQALYTIFVVRNKSKTQTTTMNICGAQQLLSVDNP